MKKIIYALILIAITGGIIYLIYLGINNNLANGGEPLFKKYVYNSELLDLGYTKTDISEIKNMFTEEQVKTYLLEKKYDSLLKYAESPIFNIEHIDRYSEYDNKTDYNEKDVVTYVEIGLDIEFYTNITEVANYDDKLVLVNKYYKLPSNYSASDLVSLGTYCSYNGQMKSEAATAIKSMIDASKNDGLSMKIISAYRTESLQNTLFTNSTKRNGIEHALIYSAKPGHSEHQTGYAADINTTEESFKDTSEYTWLQENAYKYGFIERYPSGKEFITGYGYEPWHYRYVGVDVAKIIHEKDITFEEYIVLYN